MKHTELLALTLSIGFLASCGNKSGDDFYDVSNPYAAPDYAESTPTPSLPSDLNPAYDAPALYEENSATPEVSPAPPAPKLSPSPTVSKPTSSKRPSAPKARVHSVVRGDTLLGIAKKYKVSASAIKQANGMKKDTVILDTKLRIPAP